MERPPSYEPADPLVGRLFDDRYEVVEKIGEGGMGAVYRARQVAMDRMVALKVIHPDQQTDDVVVKRFFREMKTTSRIAHPNTVSVYDFGKTSDGTFFLAMELLSGTPLADRIREGAIPLPDALPIARGILKGLSAAHREHVVHRDLKPENIMLCPALTGSDQVKVLDFGIATFAPSSPDAASARVTASGILVGTPSYVSPEQIGGEELDHRSDLYAFGVLLFEILTGHLPFHDANRPLRVLQMHMTQDPPRPSEHAGPGIPPWLDDLVVKLLAKYPDDRPASADEVLALLDLHHAGTAPAPPERKVDATAGEQESARLVGAVVLITGVLFGLLGIVLGAWFLR